MGKKRTFKVGNSIHDVEEAEVPDFLDAIPDAKEVKTYIVDGDTLDVPLEDEKEFLSDVPDAKPLFSDDGDTTSVPVPPMATGRDDISDNDIPSVKMDENGEISPIVKIDKKAMDALVKGVVGLPENVKGNKVAEKIFVNTFSKKTNIDSRAVQQIFDRTRILDESLKTLKQEYERNPDNTDVLYKIADAHTQLGQYDLAYEAYDALEGKLYQQGLREYADPNNPNKRPDYVQQKQIPAVAGMAYVEELRGNKENAQRLKKITESFGYKGQDGLSAVGDGSYIQPSQQPSSTPTEASEYLNGIADAIGAWTFFKPGVEMTSHGLEKTKESLTEYESIADNQIKLLTGLVETAMGVAGMATSEGAVFMLPFMQVQNSVPPKVAEWMMPISKMVDNYYKERGERKPTWAENTAVLADLGFLGIAMGVGHGLGSKAVKGIEGAVKNRRAANIMKDWTPDQIGEALDVIEKRIEVAGGVENYAQQKAKVIPQIAEGVKKIAENAIENVATDLKAEAVEPYTPEPAPNSLRLVKEGADVMMDGVEGKIERGDDGTWYFVNEEGKSSQIKVQDKFNPTETLDELGITVFEDVSPEQVARAMGDAEQTGVVEYKGKKYFVSIDRVGNENPTGDHVFRVMADGSHKNIFDGGRGDVQFFREKKLAIINKMLAEKGLKPRKSLIEPWKQEKPKTDEVKTETERGQEGREVLTEEVLEPKVPITESSESPVRQTEEVKLEEPVIEGSDTGDAKAEDGGEVTTVKAEDVEVEMPEAAPDSPVRLDGKTEDADVSKVENVDGGEGNKGTPSAETTTGEAAPPKKEPSKPKVVKKEGVTESKTAAKTAAEGGGTPIRLRDRAKDAVNEIEKTLLELKGIKKNIEGVVKAGYGNAEETVKFIAETIRKAIDISASAKDALEYVLRKIDARFENDEFLKSIDKEDFKAGVKKKIEEAFKKANIDIESTFEDVFSLKNEMTDKERKFLGIEERTEITDDLRRSIVDMQAAAADFKGNVDNLVDVVLNEIRTLSAEEQLVLLNEHIKLTRRRREIVKSIEETSDSAEQAALRKEYDQILSKDTDVLNAIAIAGSEIGRALNIRRLMVKADYSAASSIREYEALSGEKVPEKTKRNFEEIEARLDEMQQRMEFLEGELKKAQEEATFDAIKESVGRETKKQEGTASKASVKLRNLAKRAQEGKISKLGGYKSSSGFDAAWDAAMDVFSEALNKTADLADAIQLSLEKIRDTDFYRGLSDKLKFESDFDKHMRNEYEKSEYDNFTIDENGNLRIDYQLLRDLVQAGVKDAKDLAKQVYELIEGDIPDLTMRQVEDAISGYGRRLEKTPDDIRDLISQYKRDLQLSSGLADVKAGKGVLRTGRTPTPPTPSQREMMRKIREELKNYPQDAAEIERKYATALDRIKKTLENAITDNEKRLDELRRGVAEAKTPKERTRLDEDAQRLKDYNESLKEQIRELEPPREITAEERVKRAIDSLERAEKEYKRKEQEIRTTGTYTTKPTVATPETPELRAAKASAKLAKQKYEQAVKDNNLDVIKATRKALEDALEVERDLRSDIANRNIGFKQRALSLIDINNPQLKQVKERQKQLREIINTMREESGIAEARRQELWKRRKEKAIKELEEQEVKGEYTEKKNKRETVLTMEMDRLKAKEDRLKFNRDVALELARFKSMSEREKFVEHAMNVLNMPKSLMSSLDISAVLRQGFVLSARRPASALKAFKYLIDALKSKEKAEEFEDAMRATDLYIIAKKHDLFLSEKTAKLTAREEAFASSLAEDIPIYGKLVAGSNRAFSTYLNYMRMDAFGKFHEALRQDRITGKELDANLKAMADFINNATGRGKLGKNGEMAAPFFNALFFAPRYVASRVNLLYNTLSGFALKRGVKYTGRVRIEAYKTMAAYASAVSAIILLLRGMGGKVELDARSSDFLKVRFGKISYDFLTGFQQIMVLATRLATYSKKDKSGEIEDLGFKYGQTTPFDLMQNFARTKASPALGTAINLLRGEDLRGNPYGYTEALYSNVLPLYLQDMNSVIEDIGVEGLPATAFPAILGAGVQTMSYSKDTKESNLPENVLKDFDKHFYSPQRYRDETYYRGSKEVTMKEDEFKKINEIRNKVAGQYIKQAYRKGGIYYNPTSKKKINLKQLDKDDYKKAINSIYARATLVAKHRVLKGKWSDKKPEKE